MSKLADKARELLVIRRRGNQVYVVCHKHRRVDRDSVFLAGLQEATEKEVILARVREEASTIVASQNQMVRVVRNDQQASS